MKKFSLILLSFLLLFSIAPMAAAQSQSFWDVSKNHWAYDAIHEMAKKGIITGYPDGSFRPNDPVTRAEFAKIMIAASGIPMNSSHNLSQTFEDVPRNHWAFRYIEYAKPYLTGYQSGSTYTYKPNENAVREDIAVALVRLMSYDSTKTPDLNLLEQFKDRDEISTNLRPFIALAISTNLISGYSDRTFRPQAQITRAEAASLLYRTLIDRETKIVFPPDPKKPVPNDPKTHIITDDFSDSRLKNWNQDRATGNWRVYHDRLTVKPGKRDPEHLLLPLKWDEDAKVTNYEMEVTIYADDTDDLGGLFFNGKNNEADLIWLSKNSLNITHLKNRNKSSTTEIASINYKLQYENTLRVVVIDQGVYIYLNGEYVYGNSDYKPTGRTLGLYLNKDALGDHDLDDATWFDNFSLKYVK